MVKRFLPVALIVAAMAVFFALGLHRQLSLSAILAEREMLDATIRDNLALSVAAFALLYMVAVALSFPGASLMTIAGGLIFGWVLAGTVVALAATAGAVLVFLAARTALGESLREKAGPFLGKLRDGFARNDFTYLLFLRLTPLFPFWLVNLAPAFFGMRLRRYVAATLIGILPGTYVFAYLGSGLDSLIAAQEAANPGCVHAGTCEIDPGALVTRELLIAFTLLGLISLLPAYVNWLRRERASQQR